MKENQNKKILYPTFSHSGPKLKPPLPIKSFLPFVLFFVGNVILYVNSVESTHKIKEKKRKKKKIRKNLIFSFAFIILLDAI